MTGLPHVEQMEMALLGAVMEAPDTNGPLVFGHLPVEQFSSRVYHLAVAVADRLAEQQPITPQLVLDTMRLQGRLRPEAGPLVSDCLAYAYATPSVRHYVDALADIYAARRLYQVGARVQQMAGTSDVQSTLTYLGQQVHEIGEEAAQRIETPVLTLADILAEPDPGPVDWLMEGILPASDRLLITAEEGMGKSTMLRQAALSVSLGVQMFEPSAQIEPQRALLIDAEVSRRQLVTALRRMHSFASRHTHTGAPDNLVVESRQGGINLCDPTDQAWLLRLVRQHRPRLLALGPLYRMVEGDIQDEEQVRCWQRLLEPLLEENVSIIMEHHSPNATDRNGRRDLRPIGSSVIRRWFSQGVGVRGRNCQRHDNPFCAMCPREGRIEQWRGSRDETAWPYLIRSPGSDIWWMHDVEGEATGSR